MKPILIAGMALMASAVIYGFIDFKGQKENVVSLYEARGLKTENTLKEAKPETKPVKEEIKEPENKVDVRKAIHRNTKKEEASGSEKNDPVDELIRKERKINRKMFSRAPLDEKYLKDEDKAVSEKPETNKN